MSVRQRVLHSAPLIAFALAIVFLGLSLGGYDPADPPGQGADPVNQPPTNPCGPVGAVFAHILFTTLGWSSWLLLVGLAVVNLLLTTRRPMPDKVGPALGFALVLVGGVRLDPQDRADAHARARPSAAAVMSARWSRSSSRCTSAPSACGSFWLPPGSLAWRSAMTSVFLWPLQEIRGLASACVVAEHAWARFRRMRRRSNLPARSDPVDWESPGMIPATAIAQVGLDASADPGDETPAIRHRAPTAMAITQQRTSAPASRARHVSPPLAAGLPVRVAPDGIARARDSVSRSRSTRPRSTPGPCCWSGHCSISAIRSASSRSTPAR